MSWYYSWIRVGPTFFQCQIFVEIDKNMVSDWWHTCQAGLAFYMKNATRLSTIVLLATRKIRLHMCRKNWFFEVFVLAVSLFLIVPHSSFPNVIFFCFHFLGSSVWLETKISIKSFKAKGHIAQFYYYRTCDETLLWHEKLMIVLNLQLCLICSFWCSLY